MKRTRLKHTSTKQARLQREHRQARRDFLSEFPRCWFCGAPSTETHEIASGTGIRNLAFGLREAWAAACNHCNFHRLTDRKEYPVARQMAVKLVSDPEYFDLELICKIRGRALTATTLADVAAHLSWR